MVDVRYAVGGLLVLVLAASTAFAAPTGDEAGLAPVDFRETLTTGLTGVDVSQAEQAGYAIPRGQVFYSQYEYVVGYYGIGSLVEGLDAARRSGGFGRPLAIFVTDFSGSQPALTDDGYVTLGRSLGLGWVRASEAVYVVGSRARTPGGSAVLPFADESAARAFATAANGTVVDWDRARSRLGGGTTDPAGRLSKLIEDRSARADRAVRDARELLTRPVSVTVGSEFETMAQAIDAAPPNTTVSIPPGRYDANLTIEKPVSLRGAGPETVLDGGDTGSLLTIRAERVAIANLSMVGVGDRRVGSAANATGDRWDERIRLIYGRGDAAIRLADAAGSLVSDVTVETPANGIVALNSSDAVVDNVTVRGSETWEAGFMGVLAMYSDIVVQNSTLIGGRDGVYTHHAHGVVIRNNTMRGARFGVHEMFTSDTLVANNTVRDQQVGIIVMTRPTSTVIVNNDVRDSDQGINVVGSASFVSENLAARNGIGISIGSDRSYYARNTLVGNDVGLRDDTLLPTNVVTENDVVANHRPVDVGGGTRNVWAYRGRGNYWGPVPGLDRDGDGVVDRAYRPADRVDQFAARSAGARSLSRAPALSSIRGFQSALPGLRGSSLVDPAPLIAPVRPDALRVLVEANGGPTR